MLDLSRCEIETERIVFIVVVFPQRNRSMDFKSYIKKLPNKKNDTIAIAAHLENLALQVEAGKSFDTQELVKMLRQWAHLLILELPIE